MEILFPALLIFGALVALTAACKYKKCQTASRDEDTQLKVEDSAYHNHKEEYMTDVSAYPYVIYATHFAETKKNSLKIE